MPLCYLYTNLKRSELDVDIEERMAKCIAEAFEVPLEIQNRAHHLFSSFEQSSSGCLLLTIHPQLSSFCAGSRDPAMLCEIHAKNISEDENKIEGYFSKFFQVLKETTKLPGKRIVLELKKVPAAMAQIGE